MTDSAELIRQAAWVLGAGGGTAAIAAFVRGLANGSTAQEQHLREGLAERVGNLETKVERLEAKLDDANRQLLAWRWLCMQARLMYEALALRHAVVVAPWPDVPPCGGAP